MAFQLRLSVFEKSGDAVDLLERPFFTDENIRHELRKSGPALNELRKRCVFRAHDSEDLQRGNETLNQMTPPAQGGRRTDVALYEVALHKQR